MSVAHTSVIFLSLYNLEKVFFDLVFKRIDIAGRF